MTLSLEPLLRRRGWVVLAFLLLAGAMAPGLALLEQDNSPEVFFVSDAATLERYRWLERSFGRDRGVRIVLEGPELWSREGLAWLREVEEGADALSGVVGAAGLYRHHAWRFSTWPPEEPAAFRAEVLTDPVDRQAGWVSADGRVVTVLVGLVPLAPREARRLVGELEALLARGPAGVEARLTGLPLVSRALDAGVAEVGEELFPLVALLGVALLVLALRRLTDVVLPLVLVGVCETVVFGAMGYAGARLNFVTIILAPLLFVLTLATALHLLACWRRLRQEGLDAASAVEESYRLKGWPVFWTGVTTFAGFGSLATSPLPPVRMLGLWSAFAIAFMTLAAFGLYPALLALARGDRRRPAPPEGWARRAGRAWAGWAVAHRQALLAATAVTALAALVGLGRLGFSNDLLAYLPPGHPVRAVIEELESRGLGVVTVEVALAPRPGEGEAGEEAPAPSLRRPEGLRRQARLAAELRAEPQVLGVVSAGDFVASVARYLPGGGLEAGLDRIVRHVELGRLLGFLVTIDGQRARLTLVVPMLGFQRLEPLLNRVRERAQAAFPDRQVAITGRFPLVLAAQRSLLRTMLTSFSLTLLCVALVFFLLLRGLSLTLRALVPNLWPLLLVLGTAGWLGFEMDSATVMTASILLGLAVDDTLHTLGYFRREVGRLPAPEAAITALERGAGGHLLTSLVLASGFGVIAAASLAPIARFGALSAVAILVVLAADLLLVPALLAGAPGPAVARLARRSGEDG